MKLRSFSALLIGVQSSGSSVAALQYVTNSLSWTCRPFRTCGPGGRCESLVGRLKIRVSAARFCPKPAMFPSLASQPGLACQYLGEHECIDDDAFRAVLYCKSGRASANV